MIRGGRGRNRGRGRGDMMMDDDNNGDMDNGVTFLKIFSPDAEIVTRIIIQKAKSQDASLTSDAPRTNYFIFSLHEGYSKWIFPCYLFFDMFLCSSGCWCVYMHSRMEVEEMAQGLCGGIIMTSTRIRKERLYASITSRGDAPG